MQSVAETQATLRFGGFGEGVPGAIPAPPHYTDLGHLAMDVLPALGPGDRVIHVENVKMARPPESFSAAAALMALTGVSCLEDVGKNGPAMASGVLPGNEDNPELNKYKTLFGRDSLRVGLDGYPYFPLLMRTTLKELAAMQGIETNPFADEEEGKILHEGRAPDDPVGQQIAAKSGRQFPNYATIDATPSFIIATLMVARDDISFLRETVTDRRGKERNMLHALQQAEAWLIRNVGKNDEGLLEFQPSFEGSLVNQAWMDSWDSYTHADGTIANHNQGIASIEVQVLAHDAFHDLADFYESMAMSVGGNERMALLDAAIDSRRRGEKIWQTVMERYWIEDERGGYFVLGSDRSRNGKLRPLAIRKSNMGHMLASPRMLRSNDPEIVRRREKVIATLLSSEMLARNGIRTLSSLEKGYHPRGYHTGSVWPWDTNRIARGIESFGDPRHTEVDNRLWQAVDATGGFPELIGGSDDPNEPPLGDRLVRIWDARAGIVSTKVETGQDPQAWTVIAKLMRTMRHERGDDLWLPPA